MTGIPGSASGIVMGFFLVAIYGGIFHAIFGGPVRRLLIYLIAAGVGFAIGQLAGDFLNFELLKLGKVHLVSASICAWIMLFLIWWLIGQESEGH